MTKADLINQISELDSRMILLTEDLDLFLRESEEYDAELDELKEELEHAQCATAAFLDTHFDALLGSPEEAEEEEEPEGRHVTLVQPDGTLKTVFIKD